MPSRSCDRWDSLQRQHATSGEDTGDATRATKIDLSVVENKSTKCAEDGAESEFKIEKVPESTRTDKLPTSYGKLDTIKGKDHDRD